MKAEITIAHAFTTGNGVKKDPAQAFSWFLKAADAGDVPSMVIVAKAYEFGTGVQTDMGRANSWWKKAAEAGNAEAQYSRASQYAFTNRGTIFVVGDTVAQRNEKFAKWMRLMKLAAAQGYPNAEYQLGMVYMLGARDSFAHQKYLSADQGRGLTYLESAANANYWRAQWALAVLYQAGFGQIHRNKPISDHWWAQLAAHTNPKIERQIGLDYRVFAFAKAAYKIGKNKYQGRNLTYEQSNEVAAQWLQKAAAQRDAVATYALARMYERGEGVWQDQQKAAKLFERAADLGNHPAQAALGFAYIEGEGVIRDYAKALTWLRKAANADANDFGTDTPKVRNALGVLYERGLGTKQDLTRAYAWYNIASANGYAKAKVNLARVEKELNPSELALAQAMSSRWKPGRPMVSGLSTGADTAVTSGAGGGQSQGGLRLSSIGSGIYVTRNGDIATNHHVVDGCNEIRIPSDGATAKVRVSDLTNDLALITANKPTNGPVAVFPKGDALKQGEQIYVFGFPLEGFLPSAGNFTVGIVSALAGPQNNSSLIQITAPVQPGNSGGPVLDTRGRVVGIVVGKANAIRIAQATGDIPENINFAIAESTVKEFLDANNIQYNEISQSDSTVKRGVTIANAARAFTIKVECWK